MPKTKLQKIISYIIDLKTTRLLLSMRNNGYLLETGWLKSHKLRESINASNQPIPWTTYSYIRFIESYLKKNHLVFEFGSGNSTLFYGKLVEKLVSVEHDSEWFKKIESKILNNTTVLLRDLNAGYERTILDRDEFFDIIIIDGRKRIKCIETSIMRIKENGIIVLDDSEREKYKPGIELLISKKFKRIDFWGISPGYFNDKCTTIFFKQLTL